MGFIDDLEPVQRPIRINTNPPYYDFKQTNYNADNYPGGSDLASAVRADLAAAKAGNMLPRKLGTRVSLRLDYPNKLAVTVSGVKEDDLFEVQPGPEGIVGTVSGVMPGDAAPDTGWTLNRDWAFVLLQVFLIADGYNMISFGEGDDYVQRRYDCSLSVKDVGSFTGGHLAAIVDGLDEEL